MSHHQKSQPSELERGPQAQIETPCLVGELVPQAEEEATATVSPSTCPILDITMKMLLSLVPQVKEEETTTTINSSPTPLILDTPMEISTDLGGELVPQAKEKEAIAIASSSSTPPIPETMDLLLSMVGELVPKAEKEETTAIASSSQTPLILETVNEVSAGLVAEGDPLEEVEAMPFSFTPLSLYTTMEMSLGLIDELVPQAEEKAIAIISSTSTPSTTLMVDTTMEVSEGRVGELVPQAEEEEATTTASTSSPDTTIKMLLDLIDELLPQIVERKATTTASSFPTPLGLDPTMKTLFEMMSELAPQAEEEDEAMVVASSPVSPLMLDIIMEGEEDRVNEVVPQAEEKEATAIVSSSSAMVSTPEGQFNLGSSTQQCLHQCPQCNLIDSIILQQNSAVLTPFLLLKYWKKELVTKEEMLNYINKDHQHYFPMILDRIISSMRLLFGINMKEVDPTFHYYELATAAGITYDGLMSNVQGMPKTGLLIIVLCIIFMEGNRAKEEVIWKALSVMGVYPECEHYIYGNPRKLIMEDFVREQYLQYQAPYNDLSNYHLAWGPRAYAETSKMKVLEHWAQFSGLEPRCFPSLYEQALKDEEALSLYLCYKRSTN
ncbi:melanoma-associated antigen E1-like [Perognathus longimembris pacificus]|uniref:melanoma-associated antigen E1-like n=1 Tax=Perognathus longimembris pacificus TaxID=214514 RepID=UPI0020186580|nr:melanoma-associated antigen E1-like [Perognathus longimembris pacificus]